jgi:hypothetical protein
MDHRFYRPAATRKSKWDAKVEGIWRNNLFCSDNIFKFNGLYHMSKCSPEMNFPKIVRLFLSGSCSCVKKLNSLYVKNMNEG